MQQHQRQATDKNWRLINYATKFSLIKNVINGICILHVEVSDLFNSLWPSDAIWRQEIWVNIGSGNGLLPDGTKPLPEPMLTYRQKV